MARTKQKISEQAATYTAGEIDQRCAELQVISLKQVKDTAISAATTIGSPAGAAKVFQLLIGEAAEENMVVLVLDVKNRPLAAQVVARGAINGLNVAIREIFKAAILNNAAAIIMGHNHPSGDCTPSPEDHIFTRQVINAGSLLDIQVLDHIIVSDTNHLSMREQGFAF